MSANDMQVGGDHYKKNGDYQHWDWCPDNRIGYLESSFTKYLIRWRDKGGMQDLDKCRHYLLKLIEKVEQGYVNQSRMMSSYASEVTASARSTYHFFECHELDDTQELLCIEAAQWADLDRVHYILNSFERYYRHCRSETRK
jgi:hypothetical protein